MRLWADVYDASGNRQGDGAIMTLKNASVNRVLDGAGTINFSAPLNDQRAVTLLQNEARIRIYLEHDGAIRELTRGIIRNRNLDVQQGASTLSVQAVDDLDLLKRYNTLLGRVYPAQPAINIAENLAGLAGWTVIGSGGALDVTARYDGASVLKALQELVSQQGLHLRLGLEPNTVEIGAFGTPAALTILETPRIHVDAYTNDDIAFIDQLIVGESSEAVANYLVPLGQGEGESALTLAKANRNSPYPIIPVVMNGKTHYTLQDTASIAKYGIIQKVGIYRQIGAVSNSDADIINAANALYDAAAAWLQRNSVALTCYQCTLKKVKQTIRPGDKVRLVYKGLVYTREGKPFDWASINDEFWVMEARENVGVEGVTVNLTLASIDRVKMDAAELVIGALDSIELQNTRIQTYPSVRSFVYRRELDSTHHARIPILLTSTTTALNRCILQLVTRPFRTTAQAAESVTSAAGGGQTSSANGAHRHRIFQKLSDVNLSPGAVFDTWNARIANNGINNDNIFLWVAGGSTTEIWTETDGGTHDHTISDHTHVIPQADLVYGIEDDSETPDTVRIFINGVERTAELGGAWGVGGGAVDVTLDITEFLVTASGGLRQKHTVEIRCDSGQGEIEATVELYETIQSIAVL